MRQSRILKNKNNTSMPVQEGTGLYTYMFPVVNAGKVYVCLLCFCVVFLASECMQKIPIFCLLAPKSLVITYLNLNWVLKGAVVSCHRLPVWSMGDSCSCGNVLSDCIFLTMILSALCLLEMTFSATSLWKLYRIMCYLLLLPPILEKVASLLSPDLGNASDSIINENTTPKILES